MSVLRWFASNDAARIAWVLAAGYLIGRARPWVRLGDWAERQIRYDGRWWLATRPRQAVVAAAFAATWPRAALYAWRHRNDPTEPVRFETQFPADQTDN